MALVLEGPAPVLVATHALAALLALTGTHARKVNCLGSGGMREELRAPYGNPYRIETAIFQPEGSGIAAEAARSLFHPAHEYQEVSHVYGDRAAFEWGQVHGKRRCSLPLNPWTGRRKAAAARRRSA